MAQGEGRPSVDLGEQRPCLRLDGLQGLFGVGGVQAVHQAQGGSARLEGELGVEGGLGGEGAGGGEGAVPAGSQAVLEGAVFGPFAGVDEAEAAVGGVEAVVGVVGDEQDSGAVGYGGVVGDVDQGLVEYAALDPAVEDGDQAGGSRRAFGLEVELDLDAVSVHEVSSSGVRGRAGVEGVGGFDEELGFLDAAPGLVFRQGAAVRRVGGEEVVGELGAGVGVVEALGVAQASLELAHDLVRVVGQAGQLAAGDGAGEVEHCLVGAGGSDLDSAGLEGDLGFEGGALALRQGEVDQGDDFAGALADAEVGDGVLASVAPVGEQVARLLVGGQLCQVGEQLLDLDLADPPGEGLEALAALAMGDVEVGQPGERFGHALRRHRHDG